MPIPGNNKLLWTVGIVFILLSGYTMAHHEVWGDELHSWNIAKGSNSYSDLIAHTRYEGHPPGWYSILWVLSKFTHQPVYMQAVQWIIACSVVFLVLFFSPFPLSTKVLLPFGYYFIYEYAVLSRNYAIGVLLTFAICLTLKKEFKYKEALYYILLFCLSNVHLLALLLAGSLHFYFLLMKAEQQKKRAGLLLHVLLGALVLIPAAYCIFPPADSQINVHFWLDHRNAHQLTLSGQAPLRAFLPIPAWWLENFWNTQFLLTAKEDHPFLKVVNPLIILISIALPLFILRKNRKSQALFGMNLILSFILAISFFLLASARHTGYIYICFLAAWWFYCSETPVDPKAVRLVNILLVLQLVGGLFAVVQDLRRPFSNLYRVNELIREVPAGEKIVTTYWTMNGIVAFTDKPAYCIDMERDVSFVLFDRDVAAMQQRHDIYTRGIRDLFAREGRKRAYLISTDPLEKLYRDDKDLSASFRVTLLDKREGAIEKGSNLYLYRINDPGGNP